jgi:NAD(P)-dependent dehydrogenase (short-subunit alcohol dehydrogenase family)
MPHESSPPMPSSADPCLRDKVYVVTGAAGGLGSTVAAHLAEAGARLLLTDRDPAALERVVSGLGLPAERAVIEAGDITDAALGHRLGRAALARFGRLDGGVSAAGVIFFAPVLDLAAEHWDTTIQVNLRGTFFFVQGIARAMIDGGSQGGSIVTISATSANGPRPNNADYGASKHAVEHVTRTFALDLAPRQIRVNAVSPGVIPTAMWEKVDRERGELLGLAAGELTKAMADRIPLGRIGRTAEVADAVLFFLSDRSSFATGQVLTVDGGFNLANA